MAQPIMNALDAIAGSQASAYVTMADGNRYCFMQLYSFESKMDISVAEVPILGKSGKGNKPTGWSGKMCIRDRVCTPACSTTGISAVSGPSQKA